MSEFFSSLEGRFVIAIVLSVLFGYLIGMERETRGKDAGVNTHIMVVCGAMFFTFISPLVDKESTSRIAAQIVTGIGFLGAGIILKEDDKHIKNLTTAASIWFAGAIGMAIGYEFYVLAGIATVASAIVPRIPTFKKTQETLLSKLFRTIK